MKIKNIIDWLKLVWSMPNTVWEMQNKTYNLEERASEMSHALADAHAKIRFFEDRFQEWEAHEKWSIYARLDYLESTHVSIYTNEGM